MKKKFTSALFVLLLTPSLLFAASPTVTAIDQKLNETIIKIDALTAKLSALADSVDNQFSTGTYISRRSNPWPQLFPSVLGGTDRESGEQACTSFCSANWADQVDSCNEICEAAATGELSDCTTDASASLTEKHGFRAACGYGKLIITAPVDQCSADVDDPTCLAYTRKVMKLLHTEVIRYERGH